MALIIFQYCLPLLLGYTLFVGLAGRYNPFARPHALVERPSWFLGVWTGVSISAIVMFGLQVAYRMDLNNLSSLVTPGVWLIGAALLPGLLCFLWYRSSVKRQIGTNENLRLARNLERADDTELDSTVAFDAVAYSELDDTVAFDAVANNELDDTAALDAFANNKLNDTVAIGEVANSEIVDTAALDAVAGSELDDTVPVEHAHILDIHQQTGSWAKDLDEAALAHAELDETQLFDITEIETNEPHMIEQFDTGTPELALNTTVDCDEELTAIAQEVDTTPAADIDEINDAVEVAEFNTPIRADVLVAQAIKQLEAEAIEVETQPSEPMVSESEMLARITAEQEAAAAEAVRLKNELDIEVQARHELLTRTTAEQTAAVVEATRLKEALETESKTRKELETHLRITRNGLGVLESESREFESKKAAALMEMEKELEEKIKRTSSAEARADREATKVADLENEMVQLREDSLKAINESRVSVEARAKALSTANKATTFARQAMQIRTRLETQLRDAEAELANKQSTISSLIKALEKEKSRTQEEVASLAKQLRLHEKQLQARRTLEEVSRSVDAKLSTRLVKKVARARG